MINDTTEFLMLRIPEDKPPAWDVADAILNDRWGMPEILEFIKQNRFKPQTPKPEPDPDPRDAPPLPDEPPSDHVDHGPEPDIEQLPFKCLGYDRGYCFYLPSAAPQVIAIKAENHTHGALCWLAPRTFWERKYPSKRGPRWAEAGDDLIRISQQIGVYSPDLTRGRGAWREGDDVVLHLGDRIFKNGQYFRLCDHKSQYVYEAAPSLAFNENVPPLSEVEAYELLKIAKSLHWEDSRCAYYLAGWIVAAPLCGALSWCPHAWLTGSKGTGKTYIIKKIINPCLDPFVKDWQSSTTEAGMRQKMRQDAIPIILDEAEGETEGAKRRIQSILELARQASSSSDGGIIKGSQNGNAVEYKIRSMFLLSSINVHLKQAADISRVTLLPLRVPVNLSPEEKGAHLKKLNNAVSLITPDWSARLRARSFSLAGVINENAKVFALGIAEILDSQRAGDQLGILLAAAFSLTSRKSINLDFVRGWLSDQDFKAEKRDLSASDEYNCVTCIMSAGVQINGRFSRKISELLILCNDKYVFPSDDRSANDINITPAEADEYLRRIGIKFDASSSGIIISNAHPELKTVLKGSPWSDSWAVVLSRIIGAKKIESCRFHGIKTRAVWIPWDFVFGGAE